MKRTIPLKLIGPLADMLAERSDWKDNDAGLMEPASHLPDARAKTLSYAPAPWNTAPSPEHLKELALAKTRGAKIRRAYLTAKSSAWTLGIFAALTFMCGIGSFSIVGSVLGAGMLVVTWFEFKGADQIKRLDSTAPARLAINQLCLGAMLFAYGAYALLTMKNPVQDLTSQGISQADLNTYLPDLGPMVKQLFVIAYGSVMAVGLIGPGLTALYYRSRRRFIEQYVKETPAWILELQRAGMSV